MLLRPDTDEYGDRCSSPTASSLQYDNQIESSQSNSSKRKDNLRNFNQTTSRFRNFESEVQSMRETESSLKSVGETTPQASITSSPNPNYRHVHWADERRQDRSYTQEDAFAFDSAISVSEKSSEFSGDTVIRKDCAVNQENPGCPDMKLRLQLREKKRIEQERKPETCIEERVRRLKEELAALHVSLKPRKQSAWCKGKAHDQAKFPSKKPVEMHSTEEKLRFNMEDINLSTLRSEFLEKMNETELRHIIRAFLESNPRLRFKERYPFLAEGMYQKDFNTAELKVFSSRLGRIRIPDTRSLVKDNKADYVYFMVLKPGVYRGFLFETHPTCLISAKFPNPYETVIHGYAILAHPFGSHQETIKEDCWVCWNDSLGMMSVRRSAALFAMKKQPMWDKQLDIVSVKVSFGNGILVDKVVALTNSKDKEKRFPEEIFLIEDAVFAGTRGRDYVFNSETLKSEIFIGTDRIGTASSEVPYELVVAATFVNHTKLVFRCLLIIPEPTKFWKKERLWIRDLLRSRTDAYRG